MENDHGYEVLDHPADLLVRVQAPSLRALFETATRALFELRSETGSVRPGPPERVVVTGGLDADLLVEWLGELLSRMDAREEVYSEARMTSVSEGIAKGEVRGEKFDPSRHRHIREIKAVTYHGGAVRAEDGRFTAELLFDI